LSAGLQLQVAQVNEQRNAGPVAVVNLGGIDDHAPGFRRSYRLRRLPPNLSRGVGIEPALDGDGNHSVTNSTSAEANGGGREIFFHDITNDHS
jgi:hypothetical protein